MDAQQITQGQLAAYLGITQSAASRKLAGGRPWYPQEIQATARLLGVSVGVLFGEPEGACLAGELALTA